MQLVCFFKDMLLFNTESRGTIHSYFEIGLKPAVVSCLTNYIAPRLIVLESSSNPSKIQQVF